MFLAVSFSVSLCQFMTGGDFRDYTCHKFPHIFERGYSQTFTTALFLFSFLVSFTARFANEFLHIASVDAGSASEVMRHELSSLEQAIDLSPGKT